MRRGRMSSSLFQDALLLDCERGTIVLIGATTENPSFSLNNAILSRCRLVVFGKLPQEVRGSRETERVQVESAAVIGNDTGIPVQFQDRIPVHTTYPLVIQLREKNKSVYRCFFFIFFLLVCPLTEDFPAMFESRSQRPSCRSCIAQCRRTST